MAEYQSGRQRGGLKSIKSEAQMGFDSILTTSPLVTAGSRGSPLERKNSLRELLVKNGTIVFETDLKLEVKKLSETKSQIDANFIAQA